MTGAVVAMDDSERLASAWENGPRGHDLKM
jgi:hypothetical protein